MACGVEMRMGKIKFMNQASITSHLSIKLVDSLLPVLQMTERVYVVLHLCNWRNGFDGVIG